MARSSSTDLPADHPEAAADLTPDDEAHLLDLADQSIRRGLDGQGPLAVVIASAPPALLQYRGTFVTVLVAGELNGCVGMLHATEPLVQAVPRLAWESAFSDPRLPQLTWSDHARTSIEISLLSPLEPLPPLTEDELIDVLRPGIDGLLIRVRGLQATFLPAVWEKLPEPAQFVRHLQVKAGLAPGAWPPGAEAYRYTARKITSPNP